MRPLGSVLLLSLLLLGAAGPDSIRCALRWTCYQSPGFRLTVIDAETGQPVPDVHVLATWERDGPRHPAPFLAIDGVTGLDGVVTFPAWGPFVEALRLDLVKSPLITLFKPGYRTLLLWNDRAPAEVGEWERHRWVAWDQRTIPLEPFRGSRLAWYGQLRQAEPDLQGAPLPHTRVLQAPHPHANRLHRVLAEVRRLPRYRVSEKTVDLDQYFEMMERELQRVESLPR